MERKQRGFKQKTCLFFHDITCTHIHSNPCRKYESHKSYGRRLSSKICSKIVAILLAFFPLFLYNVVVIATVQLTVPIRSFYMITFFTFGYNDLINFQVLTFQPFSMGGFEVMIHASVKLAQTFARNCFQSSWWFSRSCWIADTIDGCSFTLAPITQIARIN